MMHQAPTASDEVTAALDRVPAREGGERGLRASTIALTLAALEASFRDAEGAAFLRRRARREVARLPNRREGRALLHLLEENDGGALMNLLVDCAAQLEETRGLAEADAVLSMARRLSPACPELALRAARVARMLGEVERAQALYRDARALDGASGPLSRLASIGEALLESDPLRALSEAIRGAVREGDKESAAVAIEERARLKRATGDRPGALRDLARAVRRYTDAVDRGRVAFAMADICAAGGDPRGAREALLIALAVGDRSQKDFARARLHAVSRDLGDQLGARRWRAATPPPMVSLSPRPGSLQASSFAPMIARWRERLEVPVRCEHAIG